MALTPASLRRDKKCGSSGIPDNARCSKGTNGVVQANDQPTSTNSTKDKKRPNILGMIGTGWQVANHAYNTGQFIDAYGKSGGHNAYAIGAASNVGAGILASLGFREHAKGNSLGGAAYSLGAAGLEHAGIAGANAYAEHVQKQREQQNRTGYKGTDPFKDLGVKEGATADEIRKAFLKRARTAHPDRGGDPAEMAKLNAAYKEALSRTSSQRTTTRPSQAERGRASSPRGRYLTPGRTDSVWAYGFI